MEIEDAFGVIAGDILRRVAAIIGIVLFASLTASIALILGEAVASYIEFKSVLPDVVGNIIGRLIWASLVPLSSGWGVLYVPCILGFGAYFIKADTPALKVFSSAFLVLSLLIILSAGAPGWMNPTIFGLPTGGGVSNVDKSVIIMKSVAGVFWLMSAIGIYYCTIVFSNRQRVIAEQHLMQVTIENQQRRDHLSEEHGIEIADRSYVIQDDDPPVSGSGK